jgi:hypothetical protein
MLVFGGTSGNWGVGIGEGTQHSDTGSDIGLEPASFYPL